MEPVSKHPLASRTTRLMSRPDLQAGLDLDDLGKIHTLTIQSSPALIADIVGLTQLKM